MQKKMKGLNGKKGLILIALMIAAMLGAYVGQYYTWTTEYTIIPLTTVETITIPPTSGATEGGASGTLTDAITVTKPLSELHFMIVVDSTLKGKLEAAFWDLTLKFHIFPLGYATFDLVIDGDATPGTYDYYLGPLATGTVWVTWYVDYWTSAVGTTEAYGIPVSIYAVE